MHGWLPAQSRHLFFVEMVEMSLETVTDTTEPLSAPQVSGIDLTLSVEVRSVRAFREAAGRYRSPGGPVDQLALGALPGQAGHGRQQPGLAFSRSRRVCRQMRKMMGQPLFRSPSRSRRT